jgi:hypothetical protein
VTASDICVYVHMSSVTRQMRIRGITVCKKSCRIEQDHNELVQYYLKSDGFPDKLEQMRCDVTRPLFILKGYFCVSDVRESCKSLPYAIQVVCKSPYVCKEDVCVQIENKNAYDMTY